MDQRVLKNQKRKKLLLQVQLKKKSNTITKLTLSWMNFGVEQKKEFYQVESQS
ncbi:unnamed protein product [Paramecium primaurelia]|uniref:Uncharacterized protein n=1 Tax=Paramecium primaurelia TaxID=5886 RepID=A0A8S1PYA5_PARPR|nr:unnamed protein product [Paramecium primaurelia]